MKLYQAWGVTLAFILSFFSGANGLNFTWIPDSPVLASPGETVYLNCAVSCKNCKIEWLKKFNASDCSRDVSKCSLEGSPLYEKRGKDRVAVLAIANVSEAHAGDYFCRASFKVSRGSPRKIIDSRSIQLTLGSFEATNRTTDTMSPRTLPPLPCIVPDASNFILHKLNETKESACVSASWKLSSEHNLCSRSSWQLSATSWRTAKETPDYDHADSDTSEAAFKWKVIDRVPRYRQSATHCGLRKDIYYEFKLEATFISESGTKQLIKQLSHLYYFGLQVPARVIWAPLRLRYKTGDTMVLACSADGLPSPDVVWQRSLTGIHQPGRHPFAERFYTFSNPQHIVNKIPDVTLRHRGFYQCLATNKQVNPPEGVQVTLDTWTVALDVTV